MINGTSKERDLQDELKLPFSKRTVKNRLLKAPMTERLATFSQENMKESGIVTPELIQLYETWGKGEIGILVTGNFMVDRDHIEAAGNIILEDDSYNRVAELKKLAAAAQAHGSLCLAQLSHPGRQINILLQPNPVGVSDVSMDGPKLGMNFGKPKPLTEEEIHAIVWKFAETAKLSHDAGFAGVELHAAHGYLLSQFLSTRTNKRTDKYGGSLKNRSRVIFEIIDAIRKKVPDSSFVIAVKINCVEFMHGFTAEDCSDLCQELERTEVDIVELSGGTYEDISLRHQSESTKRREAYFIQFAKLIAPSLTTTLPYLTGGFRSVEAMKMALKEDSCVGLGMGRPFCDTPDLAKKLFSGELTGAPSAIIEVDTLTIVAAGIQLTRIAYGLSPLNLGSTSDVEQVEKGIGEWMTKSEADIKMGIIAPGYPRILSTS